MISLAVDEKGNLKVGSEFMVVDDMDALVQDIRTRLKLVQGEFHFDINAGMHYFELLTNNNKQTFENEIHAEIMKDERVNSATILSEFKNGILNLSVDITTNSGVNLSI